MLTYIRLISLFVTIFFASNQGFLRNNRMRFQRIPSMSGEVSSLTSTPPLKLLLLVEPTPFNYISGYANRYKEMLDHLKLAKDDISIITTDNSPAPPQSYKGYPISSLNGIGLPMYKQVKVSFDPTFKIVRKIAEFRPDLIHISTPSILMFPTIVWSKLFNIPLVMSYHTHIVEYVKSYIHFPGSIPLAEFVLRSVHRAADLTLCTSPQLKQDIEDLGVENVALWKKGINTKIFSPQYRNDEMRRRLSDGQVEAPLLLYIGRLGKEKRLMRLRNVLEKNPGCRLAFVGAGPAEEMLKLHFSGYPVTFLGSMSGEPLSQAFASADIFVMPSDSETLGFVVLEAMASALPVVAVNAGGLPDIIDNGNNGYLVANDEDMIEFSDRVRQLIDDPSRRAELGAQARTWAEGWSWEAATANLRNVHYRRAIEIHRERTKKDAIYEEVADMYRPDLAL